MTNLKFLLICNRCKSHVNTEVIPVDDFGGYWDDGYKLFCSTCNNSATSLGELFENKLSDGEAAKRFHIERGCCDGNDIIECSINRAKNEAERVKRTRGRKREEGISEYDGTEPVAMTDGSTD